MKDMVYTLTELETVLKLSKPTVLKLVHSEGFPKLIIGTRLLIPADELKDWCAKNATYQKIEKLKSIFLDDANDHRNLGNHSHLAGFVMKPNMKQEGNEE